MNDSFEAYLLLGFLLSVTAAVGAVVLGAVVVVRLPPDYFSAAAPRLFLAGKHPAIRRTGLVLKNLLGALLVALGLVLALPGIPGPGIVTLLIGVMLLDVPQKRRLERWLIGRPMIRLALNRLRRRYGRPPFVR